VAGNRLDTKGAQGQETSLGELLVAARERRGLSRETVVEQTRIPARYVRMLEDDDYDLISDQLYLLPFLRKYASFLELDQDETAMRLLRYVQEVEDHPRPPSLAKSLQNTGRDRRRSWTKPMLFGALIAVMIGAYLAESRQPNLEAPTFQGSPNARNFVPSSVENETSEPPTQALDARPVRQSDLSR
jgi:cytoskeletal protein RodZ